LLAHKVNSGPTRMQCLSSGLGRGNQNAPQWSARVRSNECVIGDSGKGLLIVTKGFPRTIGAFRKIDDVSQRWILTCDDRRVSSQAVRPTSHPTFDNVVTILDQPDDRAVVGGALAYSRACWTLTASGSDLPRRLSLREHN
jgi:hypothetical protein